MRILVTAGNTQILIDRVRCITNIFTGRTGTSIALEAYCREHDVTLLTSHPEVIDDLRGPLKLDAKRWQCHTYRTFDDLDALMTWHIAHAPQDIVIHCAAVSDYRAAGVFAPSATTHFHTDEHTWVDGNNGTPRMHDRSGGKVKSDEPELWLRLVRTPKLVDRVRRDWGYRGILVKFKLEVGVSEEELRDVAESSRQCSSADWMVANTLEGATEWALIGSAHGYRKVARPALASDLMDVLEHQEAHRG
jgi:phosphopantothenate-cysteine ligase/phosphopantothenoylcysteine decarboxylase/phosphopantothenate--cysteine ligase